MLLIVGLLGASRSGQAAVQLANSTEMVDLSGLWLFREGDNPAFARPGLDDLKWKQRRLPTAGTASAFRWHGHGWYRRHVLVDNNAVNVDYLLDLGPAREVVEVYVNGALLAQRGRFGSRKQGGTQVTHLQALIPRGLLEPGDNVIAVRVYDPTWHGGFPSGPLRMGPVGAVRSAAGAPANWSLIIRITLGALALFISLAQVITNLGRRMSRDHWWLGGAGVALALTLLSGTGVFTWFLPLSLAVRLPHVAAPAAVLALVGYFHCRFDDLVSRRHAILKGLALLWCAVMLLVPDKVVFWASGVGLVLLALIATLYGAHVVARAARRQEGGAIPVFLSLVGVAAFLIHDSMRASSADVMPHLSLIGAVGALTMATAVNARNVAREHERVLARMMQLRVERDEQLTLPVLDAATLSMTDVPAFLDTVAQQLARELEVRRLSVMLPRQDGTLRIRASVGLPKHVTHVDIGAGSIAGLCFSQGTVLTPESLPQHLKKRQRGKRYFTDAFVAHPITHGEAVVGVLNLSDRNDGGDFGPVAQMQIAQAATQLGLVLSQLQDLSTAWSDVDASVAGIEELDDQDLVHAADKGEVAVRVEPDHNQASSPGADATRATDGNTPDAPQPAMASADEALQLAELDMDVPAAESDPTHNNSSGT